LKQEEDIPAQIPARKGLNLLIVKRGRFYHSGGLTTNHPDHYRSVDLSSFIIILQPVAHLDRIRQLALHTALEPATWDMLE
jgi:hypothetical protein